MNLFLWTTASVLGVLGAYILIRLGSYAWHRSRFQAMIDVVYKPSKEDRHGKNG